jgi:membrane fusion protein (multidrug efflux system)
LQQLFASKLQLETDMNRLRGELKELDASVSGSKAGVKGAESKLKLLKNGASSKDIEILVSSVKASQAAYDLAKLSLSYAIVRAPNNGTVVQINSHAGDIIAPGLSAMSLIDFSKLAVTAYVSEEDVAKIKLGNEVKLSIDALSGKTFKGKIEAIGETTASVWNLFRNSNEAENVDKINQAVPVVIGFDYTGDKVIPGMSATAKIKISK